MIAASFQRQRAIYTDTVAHWTSKADVPAVAAAIAGAVIGYVVQSAFSHDDIDPKQYCKGFSRLK
ncbi:MAG: hypothetical protein WBW75_05390 [Mycobacterium sp.]|uniref:hypothetical protein n=1 Tax=Mycobacterium sp. TaxID=1785 RepID=UPI003C48EC2B